MERPPPLQVDDLEDSCVRRDYKAARRVYPCLSNTSSRARNDHCALYDTVAYNKIKTRFPELRPRLLKRITVRDRVLLIWERLRRP